MATLTETPVMTRRWTREEYYKMAEMGLFKPDEHVQLIEGEIVCRSPQESQQATTILAAAETLGKVFGTQYHVRTQMPLALGPTSEPEPDVAVVSGSWRDYKDEHPTTALLVVEVAESTLAFDRGVKASLYAKAGIPDYWVLNLIDRSLEARREPVPMPGQPLGYGYRVLLRLDASATISPVAAPDARILVSDLLP
ncbi:MAG: Uma2 family endonuclease [Acidobacteria bacterium]|nr:Uma2 family endonuclease [Acidobacteriota bacterium]MBI3657430.1 Uma2 family endonuclease [Acidobacteriota bacterium]